MPPEEEDKIKNAEPIPRYILSRKRYMRNTLVWSCFLVGGVGIISIAGPFLDSMLGIPLWLYSKNNKLIFNPLKDFDLLADMVFEAKKSGAIILGGGTPKHHTQYIHTLRDGLDAAVQISTARAENGSLSGAPLKESITWSKLKGDNFDQKTSTITGDITIIFPLIISAAFEKINQ